jgi:hypothetical protein
MASSQAWGLALALRETAATHDAQMRPGQALLSLQEPALADRHDLPWRSERDIWRPRRFSCRGAQRLPLEFRHDFLRLARQEGMPGIRGARPWPINPVM